MILMRSRLNLTITDVAYHFRISTTTAGSMFAEWIEKLYVCFKCLVMWPSQEIVRKNLPPVFADLYPRARCIIDCSEVFY